MMKKISFSERYGMQQAVLDGTKTMTRRIIPDIKIEWNRRGEVTLPVGGFENDVLFMDVRKILPDMGRSDYSAPTKYQPRYKRGEEVAVAQRYEDAIHPLDWVNKLIYEDEPGWKNKMFVRADLMPHRIRITDIRVERLQDISESDIVSEGIKMRFGEGQTKPYFTFPKWDDNDPSTIFLTPREAFAALIDCISGRGTWQRNPWVYVYEFELIK